MDLDEDILFMAFRYALGRNTYITSEVSGVIVDKWSEISKETKSLIKKEIKTSLEIGNAGMDMDVKEWKKILKLKL